MHRYVPPRPGPLLRSRRDEDEQVLDELFGPADSGEPGGFDVALVAGGLALVIGGSVAGLPVLIAFGALVMLLGLILPTRALLRRHGRRRTRAPGLPIDTADPLVARFATAYDDIFGADVPGADGARPVAHLAALEIATLLQGGRIGGPAQAAYVLQRVELLEQVQAQLAAGRLGPEDGSADPREAQALGRLELESSTTSSLDALHRLTRRHPNTENGDATP